MSKTTKTTPDIAENYAVRLHMAAMRCGLIAAVAFSRDQPIGDFAVSVVEGRTSRESSLFDHICNAVDAGCVNEDEDVTFALILVACADVGEDFAVTGRPGDLPLCSMDNEWLQRRKMEECYANLLATVGGIERIYRDGIRSIANVLMQQGSIKEAEAEEILRTNAVLHPGSDLTADTDCHIAAPESFPH